MSDKIPPRVHKIIELLVQWQKELADNGPMQLLSGHRQANQLHERLLNEQGDVFANWR